MKCVIINKLISVSVLFIAQHLWLWIIFFFACPDYTEFLMNLWFLFKWIMKWWLRLVERLLSNSVREVYVFSTHSTIAKCGIIVHVVQAFSRVFLQHFYRWVMISSTATYHREKGKQIQWPQKNEKKKQSERISIQWAVTWFIYQISNENFKARRHMSHIFFSNNEFF